MNFSNYNVYLSDFLGYGQFLIYNLVSRKTVILNSLPAIDEMSLKEQTILLKKGILVSNIVEEINATIADLDNKRYESDILKVVITLTRDCNCDCAYCYEKKIRKKQNMSVEDALNIYKKVIYLFEHKQYKKLHVTYYGGEPLLQKELISLLSKEFYEKLGNRYQSSIVTNGTLIT